ncbi:MAG TPA: hypothetical protein DCY31_06050 [Ruminococcaceae bacterium]|nr:hypothetical protein [Oscillospiraceae bacterium]HAY73396.1 hypothetical protein [Oscillospiraceae bacterium]
MIEQDTIRLLRECDSGVKMGIAAIDDVLDSVSNDKFREKLIDLKDDHQQLNGDIQKLLGKYHDEGKNPNPLIKGMSQIKTNFKMAADCSDETIADLMTDGCNMGVKSLSRYLNQYKAADEASKELTKRLIKIESDFSEEIRAYL